MTRHTSDPPPPQLSLSPSVLRVKPARSMWEQELTSPHPLPCFYTVKKVSDFPIPSRDVTNQTLPGRE
jgi:hypothetical protein